MPDVGLSNNYLFSASDWENTTMNTNPDFNSSDSAQRSNAKRRGASNFQNQINLQRFTRNSFGKLNKNISEKY